MLYDWTKVERLMGNVPGLHADIQMLHQQVTDKYGSCPSLECLLAQAIEMAIRMRLENTANEDALSSTAGVSQL